MPQQIRGILRQYVECRAVDQSPVERFHQIALDDQAATCDVDEQGLASHPGERREVEQTTIGGVEIAVQADDVGLGQQCSEIDQLGAVPAGRLRIDQRIAREDAQAKSERTATDRSPDATESDQTQSLAGEAPHALDFIPAPAASGLHLVMICEQLTIEDEEQRERVV